MPCKQRSFNAAWSALPLLSQKGGIKGYELLKLDIFDPEAVDQEREDTL